MTFGEPGDISNLCKFGWYKWCYFWQCKKDFPEHDEELGCCLGPSNNESNEMCQIVLQMNGQVIPRSTIRRLRPDELAASNASEA